LFLYEPCPVLRRILQQNLATNRATNVTVMQRMLGGMGGAEPSTGDRSPSSAVAETIDDLQLERLDRLKINRGVRAIDVLDGAAQTLWRLRPWLFVAATNADELAALAARAKEFSYRCWRTEAPLFNVRNFNGRADDRFAGRTALALLAIPEETEFDVALDGCVELE
jgi:hypothetical protein